MPNTFVIGVDYGTDSVRSVIVDTADGTEIAAAVFEYPRWRDGLYCDPAASRFRQHPLDYIEGLETTVKSCLRQAGASVAAGVKAISVDTTGSSPVAVDRHGVPLALLPEFEQNPNAMFVLWKDHTSLKEAAEINAHATRYDINYLQYVGGIYSSEWYWAKLLHVLREDSAIRAACYSWVEHCDWVPFLLTGGQSADTMRRGVCSAGHKALWSAAYGGMPPNSFFTDLDPLLDGYRDRAFEQTYAADQAAGRLSAEWAARLGLDESVVVGIGAFDAHMGAVGGQIEPYHLSKVMGTSTCDMLVAPVTEVQDLLVRGICGQVPGSVIPGMMGMEAGQSAFGDAYAWFRKTITGYTGQLLRQSAQIDSVLAAALEKEMNDRFIVDISEKAAALSLTAQDELALDWLNGRRTPDADQELKAAITGLSLGTDAPRIFRAIAEATCFGARAIVDRFRDEGVPVKGLIGLGGVARKSPYIMQMMADVMQMPLRIHRSEQTCAAGAAMFAATAAGIYPNVEAAMDKMGQGFDMIYEPRPAESAYYAKRYQRYHHLGKYISSHQTKTN
ncbi:ribulokinase [Flavihumibacter petaseus]|uniref:L-ribulokinase n=1 Tax=Flavihumibacter petaseus NBRC 106054 TaxID=1220578 RepID=A0A0E9MZC8_9BACT|nr:ribulokinase [Flavihumibacter petaseus]GAO42455.1 L-ribulokinase [Flavihumibacter petaseus NBRC 106054]